MAAGCGCPAVPKACSDGSAVPAPAALQAGLSHLHLADTEPPIPQQSLENAMLLMSAALKLKERFLCLTLKFPQKIAGGRGLTPAFTPGLLPAPDGECRPKHTHGVSQ